jgi:hypothetical protein
LLLNTAFGKVDIPQQAFIAPQKVDTPISARQLG